MRVPANLAFLSLFLHALVVMALEERPLEHKCIQDQVAKRFAHQRVVSPQQYFHDDDGHPDSFLAKRASLATSRIRISLQYNNATLSGPAGDFVKKQLMPAAVQWFEDTLSVAPVQGPLLLHKDCAEVSGNPPHCTKYEPETLCGAAVVPNALLAEAGGSGVANADIVFFVTTYEASDDDALAWATACQFDQSKRPIAANINLGTPLLVSRSAQSIKFRQALNTVIHEMVHGLGLTPAQYDEWLGPNGKPYPGGATAEFTERSHKVYKFVTPNLKSMAAKHFGCPSLNGVEIEDAGGEGTEGSHFKSRVYYSEMMTGAISDNMIDDKSQITIAAFADMGWYQVNYSNAEPLTWGRGLGCEFAIGRCLSGNPPRTDFPDNWCARNKQASCPLGRRSKGLCVIATFDSKLPTWEQYFDDDPRRGGPNELMDRCPFFVPTQLCLDVDNQPPSKDNHFGETFGVGSRCFLSTLTTDSLYLHDVGCHTFGCSSAGLQVLVGSKFYGCPSRAGGELLVPGYKGSLTCPPASELC